MLSMTGYGKGEYTEGGIELTCEINGEQPLFGRFH